MKKKNQKLFLRLNKFQVASLYEMGKLRGGNGDDDPTTDDKNKTVIDNGGNQLCKSIKLLKDCPAVPSIFGGNDD